MPRYTAFISYSHRDRTWGDWLHRALESYRMPKALIGTPGRDGAVPAKLFPVFRDREELPSSADLSTSIQAALSESATLVVICSPNAAQSRWVNAFDAHSGADLGFLALPDGRPAQTDTIAAAGPDHIVGVLSQFDMTAKRGRAMVWSTAPGRLLEKTLALERPDPAVVPQLNGEPSTGLVASPDGHRAFVFREGHVAALPDLRTGGRQSVIDDACKRGGRNLTAQEQQTFHLEQTPPVPTNDGSPRFPAIWRIGLCRIADAPDAARCS